MEIVLTKEEIGTIRDKVLFEKYGNILECTTFDEFVVDEKSYGEVKLSKKENKERE